MNPRRLPTFAFAAALLLVAAGAPDRAEAQREGCTYLSYAQPDVLLVSSAEDDVAARANMPVLAGDSLVTGVGSRAEAVLADGNVVRVDGYTELRFERMARTYEADDDRDLLFLVHGTAAVEVRDVATRERALRFDTDDATILVASRGLFRVDAGRRGSEVYVLSGKVEVQGRGGRALVRAGEYAYVSGDSEIEVDASASPRDRFARFVEERRDRTDRRETTRYVSSDFTYDYDTASFDDYGSWLHVSAYGTYCWSPSVPAGWTPYALGYWRWTPAGMTWVSAEPWGWLPYHYGMWVYDAFLGWLWVPGAEYSPAWVYWNYTSEWVGWCPIGYYSTYYRHARGVVGGPSPPFTPTFAGTSLLGRSTRGDGTTWQPRRVDPGRDSPHPDHPERHPAGARERRPHCRSAPRPHAHARRPGRASPHDRARRPGSRLPSDASRESARRGQERVRGLLAPGRRPGPCAGRVRLGKHGASRGGLLPFPRARRFAPPRRRGLALSLVAASRAHPAPRREPAGAPRRLGLARDPAR